MKHAILLIWHKNIQQLLKLISIFDNDFLFYIHLDKKQHFSKEEILQLLEIKNVAFVCQKYDVHWGGLSIVKAEILLLEAITKEGIADYIHFMSGEDYLIKSVTDFKNFFNEHNGYEFLEYAPMPNDKWPHNGYDRLTYYGFFDWFNYRSRKGSRWINKLINFQKKLGIKRSLPNQFKCLFGGSNWISITQECAQYVVKKKSQHRSFLHRLKHTMAPDECYFHTIILNSPFASKTVNNSHRLIIWEDGSPSPTTLTEKHWLQIATSHCLLARKFDWVESRKLMEYIDNTILSTETLLLSETGYWKTNTLSCYSYDKGFAKALLKLLKLTNIETIADFGCGPAWYLASLQEHGYQVMGYDGNVNINYLSDLFFSSTFKSDRKLFELCDLTRPLKDEVIYDLVISLGVGTYIPKQYEPIFIKNLTSHSSQYLILCWTDHYPNRSDIHSIRSNDYLIDQMKNHHFIYNPIISNLLRADANNQCHQTSILFFEKNNLYNTK